MEIIKMDESTKHLLDATSIFTAVGTMLAWLPHMASLFTIIWMVIRIWETNTVQKLFGKKEVIEDEGAKPRKPEASSNRINK
jgi:ABC-type siderophore export system fused ATPase/permease subunit